MSAVAEPVETDIRYRSFAMGPQTIDTENRSVDVVVLTERAVTTWDSSRKEAIPEVVLMSGAEIPPGGRIPLLDSHQRDTVDAIKGSVADLRVEGDQLVGRAIFAVDAEMEFAKVRDGHLTDVSGGFVPIETRRIPRGKTEVIDGREFVGPMNVITKWRIKEASLTPIGADSAARFRSAGVQHKGNIMDDVSSVQGVEPVQEENTRTGDGWTDTRAFFKAAIKRNVPIEDAAEIAGRSRSLSEALDNMLEYQASHQRTVGRWDASESRADKFSGTMRAALGVRAIRSCGLPEDRIDKYVPEANSFRGWREFENASLSDLARIALEESGYNVRSLTREQLAITALGFGDQIGVRADYGYHTAGNFPQLLADARNKTLRAGYMETPATWRTVFRQGPSVPDFKTINRVRLGDVPNLEAWPGIKEPNELSLIDEAETYAVESFSNKVSFSYKLIVNDDLSAISTIPNRLGQAAARTVNRVAWAPITSNQVMQDGVALFSGVSGARLRSNYSASGGAPSIAQLATAKKLMRQQVGSNTPEGGASEALLHIEPRYIVVPGALEVVTLQLVRSTADPAASHGGVYNPAGSLIPVIEPILDASSEQAWYLFADPSQVETVEVTFLAGQETPATREHTDPATLSLHFYILQTFAAKALNFRGVYKNAG